MLHNMPQDSLEELFATMPPLEGSPRQCDYAGRLRSALITDIRVELARSMRGGPEEYPELLAEALPGIRDVFAVTQAAFWIEGRQLGTLGLFRKLHDLQRGARAAQRSFGEYDEIVVAMTALGL